jgi:hypothetical protein
MIHLIYMSTATRPFSEADLVSLLQKARSNNTSLGVTGMLLYKEGNFMQLLEGEEQVVMDLYEYIKLNTNHHSATILDKASITERQFGDWSMGFCNLNEQTVQNLPGFNPFMNKSFTAEDLGADPHGCLELLKLFRDMM